MFKNIGIAILNILKKVVKIEISIFGINIITIGGGTIVDIPKVEGK